MAVPSTFRLVRAEDHVVLEVVLKNLFPSAVTPTANQPSPFVLKPPPTPLGSTGMLRVRFPQQQIIEYATPVSGVRTVQPKPIFAPPTDVVVEVPANDPGIPLSVAGILEALHRLPLHVTGTTNTRFALPHLLALRPHNTTTQLDHLALPARRGNRTELWHSTLVELMQNATTAGLPVVLDAIPQSQSTTQEWKNVVNDNLILNALRLERCDELAGATQPPGKPARPGRLHRLRLSSLGAWLDVRGSWPPDFPDYQHKIDMGRDSHQRVVEVGRLYPFGHSAVLTSATTRSFETSGGAGNPTGRAAALSTVSSISITTPTVEYPIDATTKEHAGWPWASITIVDAVTGRGDAVAPAGATGQLAGVRLLMVPGPPPAPTAGQPSPAATPVPYAYNCLAVDRTGRISTFSVPLLFVPNSIASSAGLANLLTSMGTAFTDLDLAGQGLGVAPAASPGSGGARSADSLAGKATTVLAKTVSIKADSAGRPLVNTITARVEALERYVNSGPSEVALSYAAPYLSNLFDGANAQGQVFLQLAKGTAVDLGKQTSASMVNAGLPVAALSRELGALSANLEGTATEVSKRISGLATGDVDLSFLEAADLLLGFVPLKDLIPAEPKLKIADTQQITTTVENGVATTRLVFDVPLLRDAVGKDKPLRHSYVALAPFRENPGAGHDTHLRVERTTRLDTATGAVSSTSVCTITSVALQVFATQSVQDRTALVTVPFTRIVLTSKDGEKPEIDVNLGRVRFGGFLAFLGALADVIDRRGFNDPPALAVDDTGITSSFEFPVPGLAVGMFSLENISFATKLRLPFTGGAMSLTLGFARREDPFIVTVAMLGGGGYLEIELTTGGLQRIAGSLEFGARLSIDLFVAKASVEAMGGIYANYVKDVGIDVVAFFRIRGELEVLSLVSVSVAFTLMLTYISEGNQLFGRGEIAVNVTVLFFSETVVVPIERRFAGRNADPTFAELMAPADNAGPVLPWDTYCLAFAPPERSLR